MRTIAGIIFVGVLLLAGCGSKSENSAQTPAGSPAAAVKQYPMHGKVLSVNTADKTAKIEAGEIPGWMSAMTMDYPVKDAAELAKMAPDKNIDATVFVEGDNFWVGDVRDAKPTSGSEKK